MDAEATRALLEALEADGEGLHPALAYAAGAAVDLDEDELHGAFRRGVLLLATGGDPLRDPDPDGRAATAVAGDLDAPGRRDAFAAALAALADAASGLPRVEAALGELRRDEARAWRWLAASLLLEDLAEEGDGAG